MNIVLREMRAAWKSLLFWSLGMIALIGAIMWEYEGLASEEGAVDQILSVYPKSMLALFGMGQYEVGTLLGYYGVTMVYVYVLAGLHAVLLGANIIAKEERDKTAEFLMVKPVKWENILKNKMIAGLINILVLNLAAWAIAAATVTHFAEEPIGLELSLIQVLLFLFQLLFLCLGAFMAAILKTPKAGQYAVFTFMGFYFVKFIADLSGAEFVNYLTPFGFLSAENVIIDDTMGFGWLITVVAVAAMSFVAYKMYPKKDIV